MNNNHTLKIHMFIFMNCIYILHSTYIPLNCCQRCAGFIKFTYPTTVVTSRVMARIAY